MPIKTSCPDCDRPYNLADTMEGKTVKCKECGNAFPKCTSATEGEETVTEKPTNGKEADTKLAGSTKTVKAAGKRRKDGGGRKKKSGPNKNVLIIAGIAAAAVLLLVVSGVMASHHEPGPEGYRRPSNPIGSERLLRDQTECPACLCRQRRSGE